MKKSTFKSNEFLVARKNAEPEGKNCILMLLFGNPVVITGERSVSRFNYSCDSYSADFDRRSGALMWA